MVASLLEFRFVHRRLDDPLTLNGIEVPDSARFEACARILPLLLALAIGKLAPELILVVLPGGQHRVGLELVAEAFGTFNESEKGCFVFFEREAAFEERGFELLRCRGWCNRGARRIRAAGQTRHLAGRGYAGSKARTRDRCNRFMSRTYTPNKLQMVKVSLHSRWTPDTVAAY